MNRSRLIPAWSAIALSLGCYQYAPATLDAVPVGTHIEALLSTEGQVVLRERVGFDGRSLRGELLERRTDVVLVSLQTSGVADEFGTREPLFQRVDIPISHILRVDQREIAPARTGAVIAAAVGGVVLAVDNLFGDRNPGQQDVGGGGPDERRVSWTSRLPFSRR